MDQERENHLCDWVEDRALNKDRNSRFPGLHWWPSGKESTWQYRSREFDPWVRNIPWRRKWQPTPVLLSGKSVDGGAWRATVHGNVKELDTTEPLNNNKAGFLGRR